MIPGLSDMQADSQTKTRWLKLADEALDAGALHDDDAGKKL